jgi:hypothetical protein
LHCQQDRGDAQREHVLLSQPSQLLEQRGVRCRAEGGDGVWRTNEASSAAFSRNAATSAREILGMPFSLGVSSRREAVVLLLAGLSVRVTG